jgi:adenylate cyclase class 2
MSRGSETEIKLEVRDLAALRRKIRSLGFAVVERRHFESNTLFDFADLRLRTSRCVLRLRRADRRWLLTFKGPPAESRDYKIRPEWETEALDGGQLGEILAGLGLRKAFQYDKYRTVFAPQKPERSARHSLLFLDETPIGNYVELEGPEAWIDRMAARLGYSRAEYITSSYAALHRQACEARGESPGDMVFKSRSG